MFRGGWCKLYAPVSGRNISGAQLGSMSVGARMNMSSLSRSHDSMRRHATESRLWEKVQNQPNNRYVQAQYLRHLLDTDQMQRIVDLYTRSNSPLLRNEENHAIYTDALTLIANNHKNNSTFPIHSQLHHQQQPIHIHNNLYVPQQHTNIPPYSSTHNNPPYNLSSHNHYSPQQQNQQYLTAPMLKDILRTRTAYEKPNSSWDWKNVLMVSLGVGLLVYIAYPTLTSPGSSGPSSPMSMLSSKSVGQVIENTEKYFDDVKGVDECKQELMDVVDFLKYPEKYEKFGARIPRGILLVGPPGTGKTLLATTTLFYIPIKHSQPITEAVAQEAGVKFIASSGSEFEQAFVGVGAARMRELFKMVKPHEKAVIFIDEIDSIARNRSSARNYSQQTLNELLTQMDGFSSNPNVVVIGATNSPTNQLDSALMRPGRFDKTIEVPLPDVVGRKDICEYYLNKRKHLPNIDLDTLSRSTIGMTGAEIENCINQAAIHAVRSNREAIAMEDLDFGIDRQRMGVELSKREVHQDDREITAYHEAGHALVSHLLGTELNKVHKITIIPRGPAGGYTAFIPSSDVELVPHYQIMKHIKTAFGGRVAEEILLGMDNVTAGARGDLQQATDLARQMITVHGMSRLGTLMYNPSVMGEETLSMVDEEIVNILTECRESVRNMLNEPQNRQALERIAQALLQYETISGEEMVTLLEGKEIVRSKEGIRFVGSVENTPSGGDTKAVSLSAASGASGSEHAHQSEL